MYGSYCFPTKLSKFKDRERPSRQLFLRQGEIVTYKNEVNVILYLDFEDGGPLQKPTLQSAQERLQTVNAYVHISIFIPKQYLPESCEDFDRAIKPCVRVPHGPFCMREMRNVKEKEEKKYWCTEIADDEDENCEPPTKIRKSVTG